MNDSGIEQSAVKSAKRDIGAQTLSFLYEQRLEPTPANYVLGYPCFTESKSLATHAVDLIIDKASFDPHERDVRVLATDKPLGASTFSDRVSVLNGRQFVNTVSEADALLYQAKATGRNRVFS